MIFPLIVLKYRLAILAFLGDLGEHLVLRMPGQGHRRMPNPGYRARERPPRHNGYLRKTF
jgi:hypothetical protein